MRQISDVLLSLHLLLHISRVIADLKLNRVYIKKEKDQYFRIENQKDKIFVKILTQAWLIDLLKARDCQVHQFFCFLLRDLVLKIESSGF